MQLGELYERLVETARQKVRAGEITERKLARLCGLSQPHMHNVLKSFRSLSPESADRLMEALDINIPSLIFRSAAKDEAAVRVIPVVRNRIGPGTDAVLSSFRGFMPFLANRVISLVEPVVAQLAPDLVLPRCLAANDFVLLDQNPEVRIKPSGTGCWVVAESAGLRVRYVRLGGKHIYLANEATVHDPPKWQAIPLHGRDIQEIVRARVVWISREMETAATEPAGAPGRPD